MKNWNRKHPFLRLGMFITPVVIAVGFHSTGAGHGDSVAARLILPFACVVIGRYFGAGVVVSIVALIQWSMYGLLIDKSSRKVWAMAAIGVTHAALCWWLFTKGSENFQ